METTRKIIEIALFVVVFAYLAYGSWQLVFDKDGLIDLWKQERSKERD